MRNRPKLALAPAVLLLIAATTSGLVPSEGSRAAAATPDSPEVKEAVAKAVGFLESDAGNDHRLGGKALVALALYKNGAPADHPKILSAVAAIQAAATRTPEYDKDDSGLPILTVQPGEHPPQPIDIYSTGLSIILLCTVDPSKYSAEIQRLLDYLVSVQKPHGGWGYPSGNHAATGDTSMTQYGVLSAWEATQVGFRVPQETVEKVAEWLLRTQDPSGQYGYQGTVSDSFKPVKQKQTKISMTAAGMGSVYICADLLGVVDRAKRDRDLPLALKEVQEGPGSRPPTRLDATLFAAAMSRGNRWMGANFQPDPPQWTYYYLYALERYHSFREEATGQIEKEPAWYNAGVRYLIKSQAENGTWEQNCGAAPDTAFGVLFLLRSTRKSIERAKSYGSGMMVGGRGLPKETDAVVVRDGKVMSKTLLGSADKLLAALEDPDDPDYTKAVEALSVLRPKESETFATKHRNRIRELAGGESPEARLAAVQALAKGGGLDAAPTLIYALSDPDLAVVRVAHDGLRRISRKLDRFDLPDNPNPAQRQAMIEKWKAWYRAVRPHAEFED